MSASAEEIKWRIERELTEDDLINAWLGEEIKYGEEYTKERLVNKVARKLGIEVPREYVDEVYDELMDMFDRVLERNCEKTEVEIAKYSDRGSVSLYTCYLPEVGHFYVVENFSDFPGYNYHEEYTMITGDEEEARLKFRRILEQMPKV